MSIGDLVQREGSNDVIVIKEVISKAPPIVRGLYIDAKVVEKMLRIFLQGKLKNKEVAVLLSGRAEDGVAYLTTMWPLKVLYASGTHLEPDHSWLHKCIKAAIRMGHNIILEAHRHPIGAFCSSLDREALRIMSDWLKPSGIRYLIGCSEVSFAAYLEDDCEKIVQVPIRIWTPIKAMKSFVDIENKIFQKEPEIRKKAGLLSRLHLFFKRMIRW
ncbi:MAG: hypothetical protein QXG40_06310 [Ignisphaera sp.]